jgi:CheY-like chemotaxis protein
VEFKSETKIIGLIGCLDEENRNQLRKLPFHDYLSKPIMIDALLFILAKWIKI